MADMGLLFWAGAIPLLACVLLALAIATDLAAAAVVYGFEYVWRLIVWRHPSPHDDARFPVRRIAPSSQPVRFRLDPDGPAIVRAAFSHVESANGQPGDSLEHFVARTKTTSLLVLRDGDLLYEGYFNGHRRDTPQASHSVAKSVTSLLIGAAIAKGILPSIDIPVEKLLPGGRTLRDSGVSLRNLLNMTSGFALDNTRRFWPFGVPWTVYKLINFAPDLRALATAVRPAYRPGTHFIYDGRNTMLLGMALEGAIRGNHVATWLAQHLWQPIGAEFHASWSLDSRRCGFEKMSSGINACPIDLLKIGQLVLRGGVAESGERLLPASWIELATASTPHGVGWSEGDDLSYGLAWWVFSGPDVPLDVFAEGIFGQVLLVSRSNGIVVLRTGDGEGGVPSWPRLLRALANAIGPTAGSPPSSRPR
jgi:CubicO group peptidase (beta-lactamase class C family)